MGKIKEGKARKKERRVTLQHLIYKENLNEGGATTNRRNSNPRSKVRRRGTGEKSVISKIKKSRDCHLRRDEERGGE